MQLPRRSRVSHGRRPGDSVCYGSRALSKSEFDSGLSVKSKFSCRISVPVFCMGIRESFRWRCDDRGAGSQDELLKKYTRDRKSPAKRSFRFSSVFCSNTVVLLVGEYDYLVLTSMRSYPSMVPLNRIRYIFFTSKVSPRSTKTKKASDVIVQRRNSIEMITLRLDRHSWEGT